MHNVDVINDFANADANYGSRHQIDHRKIVRRAFSGVTTSIEYKNPPLRRNLWRLSN
jgi:hypothetical protein